MKTTIAYSSQHIIGACPGNSQVVVNSLIIQILRNPMGAGDGCHVNLSLGGYEELKDRGNPRRRNQGKSEVFHPGVFCQKGRKTNFLVIVYQAPVLKPSSKAVSQGVITLEILLVFLS